MRNTDVAPLFASHPALPRTLNCLGTAYLHRRHIRFYHLRACFSSLPSSRLYRRLLYQ